MNWLELKVPPVAVVAIVAAAMPFLPKIAPVVDLPRPARAVIGLALLADGIVFAVAGVVAFRRARTTVDPLRPDGASTLVQGGVYRVTRNPMYLGFLFALLGWAFWLANPIAFAGPVLYVLYMNRFQIAPEERTLGGLFGDEYSSYRKRVRRWL